MFKEVKAHNNRSNDNANLQQGSEGENNSDNTDIELMAAIGYLDNNTVWIKDSLESNQYTQGLFDEMNNFNSQQIIARFNERLSKSIKLQEVKNALEDNSLKGFNPRLGKEDNNGKYNPEGDNKISIPKYIEWQSQIKYTININREFAFCSLFIRYNKFIRINALSGIYYGNARKNMSKFKCI